MYVCMYICIYVCVYIYMYMYIYFVRLCICILQYIIDVKMDALIYLQYILH